MSNTLNSKTTCVSSGVGTVDPSEESEITPVLMELVLFNVQFLHIALLIVVCPVSFGH